MRRKILGFTLVELLVVVSVISILSAVLYSNFNDSRAQTRDAERKSDLRNIQSALELYKNKYGRYPRGCNGATTNLTPVRSGQSGTNFACSSGDLYITDAVDKDGVTRPFTEFMSVLPIDPKLNGVNSGYVYTVNEEGSVYKIMAYNTVEAESVSDESPFSRCGEFIMNTTNECSDMPSVPGSGGTLTTISPCEDNTTDNNDRKNDYALYGGYARGGLVGVNYVSTPRAVEYYTDIIRCK